jgi:hypothetical protein
MTMFERALQRWINPGLGAFVLTGYLLIGHSATAVATTPDWTAVAQVQPAAPVPAPLIADNQRAIMSHSTVSHDESARSLKTDLLNATLGTVLAMAWLIGGAWVGVRSARISTPLDQPADQMRNARRSRLI